MEPTAASVDEEKIRKIQAMWRGYRTRRENDGMTLTKTDEIESRWKSLATEVKIADDTSKTPTTKTRLARVLKHTAHIGAGLSTADSKEDRPRLLRKFHWLEAIDRKHRCGTNLFLYHQYWLQAQTRENFFRWLDQGAGRELSLPECPRERLESELIKYCNPLERQAYAVSIKDGLLRWKQTGELISTPVPHTVDGRAVDKWIYVVDAYFHLFIAPKMKGYFQHSSIAAGESARCAGSLVVENGVLKFVDLFSGHYRPREQEFQNFLAYLRTHGVDTSHVQASTNKPHKNPSKQEKKEKAH